MNRDFSDALVGACPANCTLRLDHIVSVHTHGRTMESYDQGAAQVRRFLAAAERYAALRVPLPELAAGLRP